MAAEVHPTATVHPGTMLGEGVKVLENAVVGKQPTLSPRSTTKREPLPPAEIGDGTVVSTGAIIFAGSRIGARVILGDQSCVRERVTIGDNLMGRTERRHELVKGPTIRRGARVGGGAILCPGIEVGEEAFVGAGAVVTRDVEPRTLVVGNPARKLRDVPDEELLENQ